MLDFLPQPLNHQVEGLEAILGFFHKCRAAKVVEARWGHLRGYLRSFDRRYWLRPHPRCSFVFGCTMRQQIREWESILLKVRLIIRIRLLLCIVLKVRLKPRTCTVKSQPVNRSTIDSHSWICCPIVHPKTKLHQGWGWSQYRWSNDRR